VNVFFPSDAGGADSAVVNQSRKESCAKFFRKWVNERTPDCKMKKPRTGGERGF